MARVFAVGYRHWVLPGLAFFWLPASYFIFNTIDSSNLGLFLWILSLSIPLLATLVLFSAVGARRLFWGIFGTLIAFFSLILWSEAFVIDDDLNLFFALLVIGSLYSFAISMALPPVLDKSNQKSLDVWDLVPKLADQRAFPAILELTKESRRMRLVSYLTLSLIGVIIFIAGLVFLFAGSITSLDLRSENLVTSIVSEIQEVKSEASTLRSEVLSIISRRPVAARQFANCRSEEKAESESELPMVQSECDRIEQFLSEAEERVATAQSRLAQLSSRQSKLEADLDAARREVFSDPESRSDVAPLVASAVTRFGVVIILMFFVQSLSSLYRYTLRLSSLYKARSIALLIADEDTGRLEKASKFLAVDSVSYGREPKTVSEEANRIIDVIGRHFGKKDTKEQESAK